MCVTLVDRGRNAFSREREREVDFVTTQKGLLASYSTYIAWLNRLEGGGEGGGIIYQGLLCGGVVVYLGETCYIYSL